MLRSLEISIFVTREKCVGPVSISSMIGGALFPVWPQLKTVPVLSGKGIFSEESSGTFDSKTGEGPTICARLWSVTGVEDRKLSWMSVRSKYWEIGSFLFDTSHYPFPLAETWKRASGTAVFSM